MSERKTPDQIIKAHANEAFRFTMTRTEAKLAMQEFAKQEVEARDELIKEMYNVLKSIQSVLIENSQAQIAGFYNWDKTDKEKIERNKIIEEYQDLIAIINPSINHVLTKAQSFKTT